MPKNSSIAQAKYDSQNCKRYGFKMNINTDSDVIEKLSQVDSMQGYIKQLVRQDLNRESDTIPVKLSSAALSIIDKKAKEKNMTAAELVSLIVNEQLIRTRSNTPELKEDKQMKTYHIKPEYLDMWEGGDTPTNPDRIITEDELINLSEDWETPVEELLEQLIPCE